MTTCPDCELSFDPRKVSGGQCPRCLMFGDDEALRAPLPDCEIVDLIARGGMGDVFRAAQPTLEREVAVKVMTAQANSPEMAARFRREALVLARLQHPNIVPIHALGTDEDGQLFYTMKLVKGRTLQAILDDLLKGDAETLHQHSLAQLLSAFRKVCDALAFAHAQGVLHRDLKPDNIMIGEFGEVLVMDWGLAKLTNEVMTDDNISEVAASHPVFNISHSPFSGTLAGAVLGTPQFMSPEQARGQLNELDERSDIYSLGALLYNILTLRPPVEGTSVAEVLDKVKTGSITSFAEGVALAKSQPGQERRLLGAARWPISVSLAAVAMKALALDKAQRYPSVTALIADVEAYQGGFATAAENAGTWKQLLLLMRRHRTVTVSLAALLALSAGFVLKLMSSEQRALNGEQSAKASATAAVQEKDAARRSLARAQTSLAEAAFRNSDLVGMVKALDECPPDLQDQNWSYLSAKRDSSSGPFCVAGFEFPYVVLAVPGQPGQFAMANLQGEIGIVDVIQHTVLRSVQARESGDVTLDMPDSLRMAFSGDGRRLLTKIKSNFHARVFDVATGTQIGTLLLPADMVQAIALDPIGRLAAVISSPEKDVRQLSVMETDGGNILWTNKNNTYPDTVYFHRDGRCLSVIYWGHSYGLHNVSDGSQISSIPLADVARTLALSHDGKRVAVGLDNGEVILIDAQTGRELGRGQLHRGGVSNLAWTMNDQLLTMGYAGARHEGSQVLRLWEPTHFSARGSFFGLSSHFPWSFNAASGHLLNPGAPPQLWSFSVGTELVRHDDSSGQGWSCGFLSDTQLLARAIYSLKRYDITKSGQLTAIEPSFPPGDVTQAIAAKPGLLALTSNDKYVGNVLKLMSYDPHGNTEKWAHPLPCPASQMDFDAAAVRLLAVCNNSSTIVLNAQTGETQMLVKRKLEKAVFAGTQGHLVAIAPIHRAATEVEDHLVVIDGSDGHERARLVSPFQLDALATSPDRRLIAHAGAEQFLNILDADTLKEKFRFRAHDDTITALAFHPTKPVIATASNDLTVKLWDYTTAEVHQTFLGLNGRPVMLAFSPNGEMLVVEGQEHSFRVFDLTGPPVAKVASPLPTAPATPGG